MSIKFNLFIASEKYIIIKNVKINYEFMTFRQKYEFMSLSYSLYL